MEWMLPNRLFGFCILRCAQSCCLTRRGGPIAEEPGKGRRGSRRTRRVRIGQFNHVRRVACRAQAGRCGRSTTRRCCLRRRVTARASAAARHRARSPALPLAGGDSIESAVACTSLKACTVHPGVDLGQGREQSQATALESQPWHCRPNTGHTLPFNPAVSRSSGTRARRSRCANCLQAL
jgi:hypothetical protein